MFQYRITSAVDSLRSFPSGTVAVGYKHAGKCRPAKYVKNKIIPLRYSRKVEHKYEC
jgi:hypothetical protein